MINLEYINIIVSIVITSIVFYTMRYGVRVLLARWMGNHFDKELTKQYRGKITRIMLILYFVAILTIFQSTNWYHELILSMSDYFFIKSQYLAINGYTITRAIILSYISYELLQIIRGLFQIYQNGNEEYYQTIDGAIFHAWIVVIVLIALTSLWVWWKVLLPLASVVWVGIWFWLQDIAKNIISWLILLTGSTLKPWDWVTVHDYFGKIHHIWLRSSVIRTLDYLEVIVPNSHLTSNHLINRSYNDHKVRISVPISVSYRSDIHQVKTVLLQAAKSIKTISSKPEPDVLLTGFGSSSVDFEVRAWINIKKIIIPSIKSDLYFAIRDALKDHNIEIPFPQQDIRFRNTIPPTKEANHVVETETN